MTVGVEHHVISLRLYEKHFLYSYFYLETGYNLILSHFIAWDKLALV